MNRSFLITAAATAIVLSGCAYTAYPGDINVAYAPGYYDGYYGPYWDGYWGVDGVFYFYDVHDHRYHRDDGHHFRHDQAPGFAGIPHRNVAGAMHGNPSHAFGGGAVHGGGARERRG